MLDCQSTCLSYQSELWLCHSITVYQYALFPATLNTFNCIPSKAHAKPIRRAHASTVLTKSHAEAVTHVPQTITYAVVEKELEHKGEQR